MNRTDEEEEEAEYLGKQETLPIYRELLNKNAAAEFTIRNFIFYFRSCSHQNKNRKHQSGLNEQNKPTVINVPVIHPDSNHSFNQPTITIIYNLVCVYFRILCQLSSQLCICFRYLLRRVMNRESYY